MLIIIIFPSEVSECLRSFPPILSDNSYSTSVNSERGRAVSASYPMDKQWCGLEISLPHPALAGYMRYHAYYVVILSSITAKYICTHNVPRKIFKLLI